MPQENRVTVLALWGSLALQMHVKRSGHKTSAKQKETETVPGLFFLVADPDTDVNIHRKLLFHNNNTKTCSLNAHPKDFGMS